MKKLVFLYFWWTDFVFNEINDWALNEFGNALLHIKHLWNPSIWWNVFRWFRSCFLWEKLILQFLQLCSSFGGWLAMFIDALTPKRKNRRLPQNFFIWNKFMHSSEIRDLWLMKLPSKTSLLYVSIRTKASTYLWSFMVIN